MDQFAQILLLMAVAIFTVWLFRRIHLPVVLAYLVCGLLAGPHGLSLYENPDDFHLIAELGVVFLLFSLGLEFSLPRMLAMRRLVFGVGSVQTLLTTLVFALSAVMLGLSWPAAVVVGGMAALSSTAVVIKQSSEIGILNTARAQLAISILLFQDLAVVPLLIIIPMLADTTEQSMALAISMAVLKGAVVLVMLLSAGKWILPRVFTEVARARTDELFVLTTLLVTLLAAGFTYAMGLSMALGAFLAGMMLGESQYKHQLEADIRPFRDILMGLFFITVGMRLELTTLLANGHWVLVGLLVLMSVKLLLLRFAAWLYGTPKQVAWASAFKLCQMGEFSFVIAALAADEGILSAQFTSILLAIGIISMALTPWMVDRSHSWARWFDNSPEPPPPLLMGATAPLAEHVVIFGFGRVGQSVSRLLKLENIAYAAIDSDPVRVQESRSAGEQVVFGDVRHKDILRSVNIETAKMAVLTFDQHDKAVQVIKAVRDLNPQLPLLVRTRKDYQRQELLEAGATQVVPEMLEGSLMLVSQIMHLSGVPMSRILKLVRSERKGEYGHMHGFFPGEAIEMGQGMREKLEFMHAVVLEENASAIGKPLKALNLSRLGVQLKSLRRNQQEIAEPNPYTRLQANDVLVISGKPGRVERAERILLEGH